MCGPSSYKPTAADKAREAEYRAEDDFRTLQRANEVTSDKARMSGARKYAAKQMGLARAVLRRGARS